MYDVIIVGARCAGSPLAMLLAQQGYRVLVVDKISFPKDTISGHAILHRGVIRLNRWHILERLYATGCPPIHTWSLDVGDFELSGRVDLPNNLPSAIAPRRTVLDALLVGAAVEAGAELREEFVVKRPLFDGNRVVGITGHYRGRTISERAPLVVGADGRHSTIAQHVRAAKYQEQPTLACWYYGYWSGLPSKGIEIYWHPHSIVFVWPTHSDLSLVTVGVARRRIQAFKKNVSANFRGIVQQFSSLYTRFLEAKQVEGFYGMVDLPNFFRKPYGLGWALVGDAGHHKDPVGAYGISDAFCDAELLAKAINETFSGEQSFEDAMAGYESARNTRAFPDYRINCEGAKLENWDAPEALRLRNALRYNKTQAGRYFAVFAKALQHDEFYSEQNLNEIFNTARRATAILAALRPQRA